MPTPDWGRGKPKGAEEWLGRKRKALAGWEGAKSPPLCNLRALDTLSPRLKVGADWECD